MAVFIQIFRSDNIIYDGFHDYIAFRVRGAIYAYVKGACPNLEKCDSQVKVWNMT